MNPSNMNPFNSIAEEKKNSIQITSNKIEKHRRAINTFTELLSSSSAFLQSSSTLVQSLQKPNIKRKKQKTHFNQQQQIQTKWAEEEKGLTHSRFRKQSARFVQ